MPGSRVNLGNGGHKSSKRPAMMKPPGMKNGGGLEMTEVGGKKVPKFAADGKGAKDLMKKTKGGAVKKAKGGALMKKKKPMGG